jgi:hypothetical protein
MANESQDTAAELLSQTFVRKEFYVDPSELQNATPEQWEAWLAKDKAAARADKAAFTRKQNKLARELGVGTDIETPECVTRKVNGVYRQVAPTGLSGDAEEGTLTMEVAVDETQQRDAIRRRWEDERAPRGTHSSGRHARRKAARKALQK